MCIRDRSYVVTNLSGKFKLQLKKNTRYKVQVNYIGLRTIEDIIDTKESNLSKNYIMLKGIVLDEVVVKIPVIVKGDTIIYDADSFTNGSERKLEDIIDKLPGVELNEDNQIEVEGKVVNKITVNGKDFFDGDTKIATKNIPSSAVDKIQVLRNYAEIGQLSGVRNNQNNVAIDIKLKEGKESFWFGDITAGLFTAIGVNAALYDRKKTGKGTYIDVSMLDCQIAILENAIARYLSKNEIPKPMAVSYTHLTLPTKA